MVNYDFKFYKNKKVLVTGHTGFKGTWLCMVLQKFGADVIGYSLAPPTTPNIFELSEINKSIKSIIGDIRDFENLKRVFCEEKPEIVFHLAAQPIVSESYLEPVYTYETNVMGTVNILECVRLTREVKSFLNVTTDKVYKNNEWEWGYREGEPLDGHDPYSNSKSCSELVTHSYNNSFFSDRDLAVSTARAGNVIGGGDFAKDRIVPDCFRAGYQGKEIEVRSPYSIRPYQHVLEPIVAYMMIAIFQYKDIKYSGYYNVGPNEYDCIPTHELVEKFCKSWGEGLTWINKSSNDFHEANFLKLDCSKIQRKFNWKPIWNASCAIEKTVELYKCYPDSEKFRECIMKQINEYLE